MTVVRVSWKAFSDIERADYGRRVFPVTDAIVDFPAFDKFKDSEICNQIFEQTNLYRGEFWSDLEQVMPKDRSHTALSVGDEVAITRCNQTTIYKCADFGWDLINTYYH
jgi:hypothetical protein